MEDIVRVVGGGAEKERIVAEMQVTNDSNIKSRQASEMDHIPCTRRGEAGTTPGKRDRERDSQV